MTQLEKTTNDNIVSREKKALSGKSAEVGQYIELTERPSDEPEVAPSAFSSSNLDESLHHSYSTLLKDIKQLICDLKEHERIANQGGESGVERGIMLGRVELEAMLLRNGKSMPTTIDNEDR